MNKALFEKWEPVNFYCENCKSLITANVGADGCAKTQCSCCGVRYRRKIVSQTHSITESYAPAGQRLLCIKES